MRTFPVLITFLAFTHCASGQKLSQREARLDFDFLYTAIRHSHPGVFHYTDERTLDSLFAASEIQDSIHPHEFELIVRNVLYSLGCIHTSVTGAVPYEVPVHLFPYKVAFAGDTMVVKKNISAQGIIPPGSVIKRINGMRADSLYQKLLRYFPSDGLQNSFSRALLNSEYFFNYLYAYYFPGDSAFHIEYLTNGVPSSITRKGTRQSNLQASKPSSIKNFIFEGNGMAFYRDSLSGAYILSIENFEDRFRNFHKQVFKFLHEKSDAALVIDLRGCKGGNMANAINLLTYLANSSFSYSQERKAHSAPARFLNRKNKIIRALGYVNYEILRLNHLNPETGIKSHTYTFDPKNELRFNGSIYVFTDGYTASSASLTASYLKHLSQATVIGMQTGGGAKGNCGRNFPKLILPYSGISIRFPVYWIDYKLPQANQTGGVLPDHLINFTVKSLLGREDLWLEKIRELQKDTFVPPLSSGYSVPE